MKLYKHVFCLLSLTMFCLPLACEKGKSHLEIANGLVRENKFDEALSEYSKAIDANADMATAYYGRGVVYFELGKLDEAAIDFRKAIDIKPNYLEAHKKLAETFVKIGAPDDEFQKRYKAIDSDPDNPLTYVDLGAFFAQT